MVNDGLLWLESCSSTNDEAAARLDDPQLVAVASDTQTQGRGRLGRDWFSPPGCGLYLSWIARPNFAQAMGGAIPMLAAAATAEVVSTLGIKPTLKWPNDVLVGQKKLSGILCEAQGTPPAWTAIVGIGLNLRTPPDGWPDDVPAIALDAVIETVPSPQVLAAQIMKRLSLWLGRVEREGLQAVLEVWATYAPPMGTPMAQGDTRGRFAGLDPDGSLRLQTPEGIVTIHAGDVELVHEEN